MNTDNTSTGTDLTDQDATGQPGFTIVREFAAPRSRVWEAWTNPDTMARWFHPETLVTPRESVTVDLRVGGEYTYTMRIPDTGQEFPTAGRYLHIDEPVRLDFTWGSPGQVDDAPTVSIELDEVGTASTRMTFTLTGLPNDSGEDASAYDGWSSAFNELDTEISSDPRD
ncbi:SRPBCC family protein [Brevibacterium spongiae]|uniref:SRPBCC domain-containing protein n=1 Tax=Brevibacterium spongiae TaxID=2909672 RepID=A0ABY5SVC4_9MICO|nr:SRPBCC domain-containing protein [Brevibacterium spongiae]UVI37051.1 SRPBCC domain-containing protein [Brevibacterium spongiae]